MSLEKRESFLTSALSFLELDDVESDRLGEGSALANCNGVANLDVIESRRTVNSNSSMSLLISVILLDEMNIVSSYDNRVLHFSRNHNSLENFSSNANVASEWALFVDIGSIDCLFGCSEAKTNVLIVSNSSFSSTFDELSVLEESSLFLKCLFSLKVSENIPGLPYCFLEIIKINNLDGRGT